MKAIVAWRGGLFLTKGKVGSGVVCVFFIFNAGGIVQCVYVGVYAHTHTHCTDSVLGCQPRSWDETPGGPEESRWTQSWHTYIRICVQSTHMCTKHTCVCMYMLGGGMTSWTNCFFL